MRAMSVRQAVSCETATSKRCRCRCGGALHGAARIGAVAPECLPDDDPHHARAKPEPEPKPGRELPGQEPFEWFGSAEREAARAAIGQPS
jgi:hypothetical protein